MKRTLLAIIIIGFSFSAFSQTVTDGLMMPKGAFCTGFMYGHEQWTKYWEGDLKRTNENIGTVTTSSLTWVGNYGVNSKLNIIAMLPYIKTQASQGTLHGLEGIQDLTLAAKYNFYNSKVGSGTFKGFGTLALSTPVTNYTPDFYPLSLGTATQNIAYRVTGNYALEQGLYFNVSGAYTWRSNTTLDRPSYYTDGQIYSTDEVKMPNVFDFIVNIGYHKGAFQADLNYMQQNTLGGGDIRRQDMPFVSNRMNFSKVGAILMYYLPKPKNLAVRATGNYTVAGRNVGQSFSVMGGLLYTIHFIKN